MKKYYKALTVVLVAIYPVSVLAVEEPLPGSMPERQQESLLPEEPLPGSYSGEQQESLLPEDTASEAFGIAGGYIHPYITLAGEYTDNLYNVYTDEKTNFLTRISPGIWFALPRTKEVPITITPHNTAAGGLQYELEQYSRDEFERFNAYILGGLDFEFYTEDSDLNAITGEVEGVFRYNMKNGLSLQILDRYSRDTDRFDVGARQGDPQDPQNLQDPQREFDANFLDLTADMEISERLRVKADYGNFVLDYDDDRDDFLDRIDNGFSLHGYLNYTESSTFFINYDFINVAYDHSISQPKDNDQHFIYVGLDWATTDKTDLLLKLGYQKKEYDSDSLFTDNPDEFVYELQAEHDFTQKTKLITVLTHKMEETDSFVAYGKTVTAFRLRLIHEFNKRLSALADFTYENADYDQIISTQREDDRFFIRPAVQYVFNDWFMAEIAYSYDTRNSTDELFDYDTNTFYLYINFAM